IERTMQRRHYLALAGASMTVLAGCSGGGGETDVGTDTITPTPTETASGTETTTPGATTNAAGNESGGLPDVLGNGTPGTPAGEFTTSAASTPMDAGTFVRTLKRRLNDKAVMTGYAIDTLADEQVVELTYVASEDNQQKLLEKFAEAFVETVERTGGTGGWSLDMTVQTGAERNVWYTWEVRDEWAVQRLTGEISREEFYSKIEKAITTPTG
ncbi:hypothetical protein BRC80_05625, partial [Halobacteriales archaeon QH_9_66_26]